MKKLIAVLMLAAFAGTTLNVAAQTPATPAAPAQSATRAPAKTTSEGRQGRQESQGQRQKAQPRAESTGPDGPHRKGGTSRLSVFVDTIASLSPSAQT
jgi:hypothetical protein